MFLKLAVFFFIFVVATETRRSRILSSSDAIPHEFPHMVTLDQGEEPHHICGGAILGKHWIITAGHCPSQMRNPNSFQIKAGKHSLRTVEKSEQVVNVTKVFVHEEYAGDVAANDIALLKLEKPLVFNEYVQPIALPECNSEVDGSVLFSGWGSTDRGFSTDILQKAHFVAIGVEECKQIDKLVSETPSDVTDTMLCVMSPSLINATYACAGDSGGPLIKEQNHKMRLVGVFSWFTYPCGEFGAPSVFTRVSSYIDWIHNITVNN